MTNNHLLLVCLLIIGAVLYVGVSMKIHAFWTDIEERLDSLEKKLNELLKK